MTNKGEQVKPVPVHSAQPSGFGQAAGEIENPVRDFTLRARGQLNAPHQQAGYKGANQSRALYVNACKAGGVHIRARVRTIRKGPHFLYKR
jgi:hypothetical protein